MNGKIMATPPAPADIKQIKAYSIINAVSAVSSHTVTKTPPKNSQVKKNLPDHLQAVRRVALMDFGAKRGITNALAARNCEVWNFPHDTSAQEILKMNPDGIMLSNGPGDPAEKANDGIIKTLISLQKSGVTIFGICLGHQLLALANGYSTKKLKFGHRGANQPVKETSTGRVYITSQNHGYAVVTDNGSFINVNDGTCEGLDYGKSFSVQFHPEACGGPLDTSFLFDRFIERMGK